MKNISRRKFIGLALGAGVAGIVGCSKSETGSGAAVTIKSPKFPSDTLAIASGKGAAKNTRAAVDALGGMSKLVKKGDFVVIKPNMAWSRPPEGASTTNPDVVRELIKMCKEAGAEKISIIDHIIDSPAEAIMGITGLGAVANDNGSSISAASNESDYRAVDIPNGKTLKNDTCIKDILKADVFINVPIAKCHSSTKLSLGMKNLMGCIWDRQAWHMSSSLDQCIADYATAIKPDLTILDANRILLTNGPKGPGETKDVGEVIAGIDPVAVDAYGATLFGIKPEDVVYIKLAKDLGVGEYDLAKIKIKRV